MFKCTIIYYAYFKTLFDFTINSHKLIWLIRITCINFKYPHMNTT